MGQMLTIDALSKALNEYQETNLRSPGIIRLNEVDYKYMASQIHQLGLQGFNEFRGIPVEVSENVFIGNILFDD